MFWSLEWRYTQFQTGTELCVCVCVCVRVHACVFVLLVVRAVRVY